MDVDVDTDWFYLGVVVIILVGLAGAHNLALGEEDAISFGYCDTELSCVGVDAGGYCLGVEQRSTQCYNISEASEHRRVEAECGVQAYNLCGANQSGTSWADEATYQNKTCRDWADEDERITLLSCDETYPTAREWKDIK